MANLSLLLAYLSLHNCLARVFVDPTDDTNILTGATLLPYCWQSTQQCDTHFGKNVFATENPIMDRLWTEALFPDMYNQFDDNFDSCGFGSKFISMDSCAQIHAPMTTYHPEANLKVNYVQQQYALKWNHAIVEARENNHGVYDSFFDNSAAYWVDDLANYESIWRAQNADIIYLRWRVISTTKYGDQYFYSMMTHNGNAGHINTDAYRSGSTLSQYELMSDTFSSLDDSVVFVDSEQRAFFDDDTDYSSLGSGCYLFPIGARRSVSDVDANVDWYKKIFASTITDESAQIRAGESTDHNGNKVKYAHVKLHGSQVAATISFFERHNTESTHGEFTILDFERALQEVHDTVMMNPFCGIDRWFDMHYAVDFDDVSASEEILENIMYSGDRYTLYGDSKEHFLYIPEPNGHSIQVVFENSYDISLYVDPFAWTWCKTNCSDDQESYAYGDAIFEWNEESAFGRKKLQLARLSQEEKQEAIQSFSGLLEMHLSMVVLIVCVAVMGLGCMVVKIMHCYCCRKDYVMLK